MNKQIIRQNVDGVEKLLVVQVIEEIDVASIEKTIVELGEKISKIDSDIVILKDKRNAFKKEIEELELALQGQLEISFEEEIIEEKHIEQPEVLEELKDVQAEEVIEQKEEEKEVEMVVRTSRPLFRGRVSRP